MNCLSQQQSTIGLGLPLRPWYSARQYSHSSDDVQWWNSDHWHANDVGHHTRNGPCPGGSMWNLPGMWREIAVFPGNWGKNHDSRPGLGPDPG